MSGFRELERGLPLGMVREGTEVRVAPSCLGLESPLRQFEEALLATKRAEFPPESTATFGLVSFAGEGLV